MTCIHCGFEQAEGKFCGKCGEKLTSNAPQQETPNDPTKQTEQEVYVPEQVSAPVIPNESLEKVKETSRAYGTYFLHYLKQPAQIFTKRASESTNGLISIVIVVFLIALSFYTLINNFARGTFGGFYNSDGASFLSVFGNTFLFTIIGTVIIIALLFAINKLFGTDWSFKDMVSIFGAHMNPVIVFAFFTFLLILMKSNTYGSFFLLVTLGLVLMTVPVYIISSLLTRSPRGIDPLYGYLLYIVSVVITFSIFGGIAIDSALGEYLDQLMLW